MRGNGSCETWEKVGVIEAKSGRAPEEEMQAEDEDAVTAFEAAVTASRELTGLSNEQKLELYALFKQSTAGDAKGAPSRVNAVAYAKWSAWHRHQGMATSEARRAYCALVKGHGTIEAGSMPSSPDGAAVKPAQTPQAAALPRRHSSTTKASSARWSVLLLSRVLLVVGAALVVGSIVVPVVRFIAAHPWLISLVLGFCLLGAGAALAISEDGVAGALLASKVPTDFSLLDVAIYIRELNRAARDPKRAAGCPNPESPSISPSISPSSSPKLFHVITWLHQLSHLAALCLVHPDDDDVRDVIADSDEDFFHFSCGPVVAELPTSLQMFLVGRAGVERVEARRARYAQPYAHPEPLAATQEAGVSAHGSATANVATGEEPGGGATPHSASLVPPLVTHSLTPGRGGDGDCGDCELRENSNGEGMAVRRRRRQLQHEAVYRMAELQTPRRRKSLLQRVSQQRLSITNQRRVIIYGKLALMPFRLAVSQVRPIVPYAMASLRATHLYKWAASWVGFARSMACDVLQQVRGKADGVIVMIRGG